MPATKAALSTVRVSVVYDQSGNNKHAYSSFYKSGENFITVFNRCQMIMAMGELITNDEGRLALSGYGYSKDNPNPFGIAEGGSTLSAGGTTLSQGLQKKPTGTQRLNIYPCQQKTSQFICTL